MIILDTFSAIFNSFSSGEFHLAEWRGYANSISPELSTLCENDIEHYNYETDVLPVVNVLLKHRESAEKIHASFQEVTQNLPKKVISILKCDLDVKVILYLGLCNGAGWATRLDGRPAVLLGIEKIMELDWGNPSKMKGLIYHELGHLWHFELRNGPFRPTQPREQALWQLYSEGMAMYAEQMLSGDMEFYHQDLDGWLDWCKTNRKQLFQEYLRRVDTDEPVQDFFGDWNNYMGHSDCGYFLGAELVKKLASKYDKQALAQLELEDIYQALASECNLQKDLHGQQPQKQKYNPPLDMTFYSR